MNMRTGPRMGWIPDQPDMRDFGATHSEIQPQISAAISGSPAVRNPPPNVDLREWCPPIEDQGDLGSCTAQAGVALVEFLQRRFYGEHLDASRLFLYKATRQLLHWTGDRGAYLRTTMKALRLFGVPPEDYWPYTIQRYDDDPPAFCYAYAQNYQALRYFRLDPPEASPDGLLDKVKATLAGGLPAMFGFTVYRSIVQASQTGDVPFPCRGEGIDGGHAVVAIGYDDGHEIRNADCDGVTVGAILIRNSWGTGWGDEGYGWLPYQYIRQGQAVDWWALVDARFAEWATFAAAVTPDSE